MNITLTTPKKNVKIVGNRATISISPRKLENALAKADEKAWEQEILSRKVSAKDLPKLTSWEDFMKEMGI